MSVKSWIFFTFTFGKCFKEIWIFIQISFCPTIFVRYDRSVLFFPAKLLSGCGKKTPELSFFLKTTTNKSIKIGKKRKYFSLSHPVNSLQVSKIWVTYNSMSVLRTIWQILNGFISDKNQCLLFPFYQKYGTFSV